jgi:hypothetical protein
MKNSKKIKVLKVHEKENLLGGLNKGDLNLNHRVAECDDPTCSCNNHKLPIAPVEAPSSSSPSSPSN